MRAFGMRLATWWRNAKGGCSRDATGYRGDIVDLLPDPNVPFVGHIALNFSADAKPMFPRRLQALLEYRTPVSAARVMAWSDVWNGRHKVRELDEKIGRAFP